jgi:hypothetical protein
MGDQSGMSCLVLFEAALQDYEKQTGIILAKHPLAEQLQICDTVESVTAVLRGQTQAFSEFRGRDKIMKPLKNALSVLHKLSATADLCQAISLVRSYALIGCLAFLTSTYSLSRLRKQYSQALLSYSLYVPYFSPSIHIFLTSKGIRRSRTSPTATMHWSNCLSQLNTF